VAVNKNNTAPSMIAVLFISYALKGLNNPFDPSYLNIMPDLSFVENSGDLRFLTVFSEINF